MSSIKPSTQTPPAPKPAQDEGPIPMSVDPDRTDNKLKVVATPPATSPATSLPAAPGRLVDSLQKPGAPSMAPSPKSQEAGAVAPPAPPAELTAEQETRLAAVRDFLGLRFGGSLVVKGHNTPMARATGGVPPKSLAELLMNPAARPQALIAILANQAADWTAISRALFWQLEAAPDDPAAEARWLSLKLQTDRQVLAIVDVLQRVGSPVTPVVKIGSLRVQQVVGSQQIGGGPAKS